ncbi:MAG: hypothetical protein QXJ15_03310 [Candidatus Bathyarchaeia archaeon]
MGMGGTGSFWALSQDIGKYDQVYQAEGFKQYLRWFNQTSTQRIFAFEFKNYKRDLKSSPALMEGSRRREAFFCIQTMCKIVVLSII